MIEHLLRPSTDQYSERPSRHRRDVAQRIALTGQLDFDDFGAAIGEQGGAERRGDHGRDIQHAQASERSAVLRARSVIAARLDATLPRH